MEARWSIWLLNEGEPPVLYFNAMLQIWTEKRLIQCAQKVFDGSDADAMMLVRSDKHPSDYNTPSGLRLTFSQED